MRLHVERAVVQETVELNRMRIVGTRLDFAQCVIASERRAPVGRDYCDLTRERSTRDRAARGEYPKCRHEKALQAPRSFEWNEKTRQACGLPGRVSILAADFV